MSGKIDMLTILGHTAAGKTRLGACTAYELDGEVISADSRQVYRGMDIGTGKDYKDYVIGEKEVAVHLVDIADAGYEYSVFEFQRDFLDAAQKIRSKSLLPVLCGGTGLYIESVIRQYNMTRVPVNSTLRKQLELKDLDELKQILKRYRKLHNITDTETRKRAIRAIEIAEYMDSVNNEQERMPTVNSLTFGVAWEREERRRRITERLKQRFAEGMIEETEDLLKRGVGHAQLEYYGLEYKYLSRYLSGLVGYDEMFQQLNTAIHRFAKRQMTYFRGMERRGVHINWIRGELSFDEKIETIRKKYNRWKENLSETKRRDV
ncbi:MAG: tRNA (adenosine(37)-N6)-dimethylallyltransferase MiaA [Bacteroidales bacterium]|nr:tRNA (adenosine(37)-N6)-dimethylallyltransferase MiaA [Bacteroidales bacterium]